MYIIEIFFKRGKFMSIFERAWALIGDNFANAQQAADDTDPQLELLHFAAVFYCTVYQAALSAGMSSSSAHYLARIQTRKTKVGPSILAVAQDIFAVPDDEKLRSYGDCLQRQLQPIVAAAADPACQATAADFTSTLNDLYADFQGLDFSAKELFASA